MNFDKSKTISILARLIFVVAFSSIFFIVAGFEHRASVWIAFAMINITYLVFAFTPFFTKGGKTALETGAPLAMISGANFALHFIIGLIFMLVAPEDTTFEIVLYIILVAIYLGIFLTVMFANTHTEQSAARQSKEAFFIKNQASKIKMLIGRIADSELNKLLETTSDNMHASPSRSTDAAVSVEASITMKVIEVEMAVIEERTDDAKKSCRELYYLIEERKRILSINY